MRWLVLEEPLDKLSQHAEIPIRFEVCTVFKVEGDDPSTAVLRERPANPVWVKDYDAITGEGPTCWAKQWDLSNGGLLAAYDGDRRIGGCVLAYNTDRVNMLEGCDGLVVLWDIRVRPEWRGRGVGRALFVAAVAWAKERNCRELTVETQNINVPACRFYQRQGCRLWLIDRDAYPQYPEEIELNWKLGL